MALHLPIGWSRYRDANPEHTSPLADDIATAPSGPVQLSRRGFQLLLETSELDSSIGGGKTNRIAVITEVWCTLRSQYHSMNHWLYGCTLWSHKLAKDKKIKIKSMTCG